MDVWIADPARDAPIVAALRIAWSATSGTGPAPADDTLTERIRDWWIRDRRTVFVAGDRQFNGVAGMVALHEYLRMPMPGAESTAWGYVGHLFVLPAARGEGHGSALIRAVQQEASDRGYRRLVLSPSEESIPLYRRTGFRAADELMVWEPDAATS